MAEQDLKEARKLRELFKGRFSDAEALELLNEHGNLSDAVDFVLNGDPAEVRKLINDRNKALVDNLRRDSAYVNTALKEGLEAQIRLFACKSCDRYWWRKVPARKEVSRCKFCKQKYDPVPRDQEWGLGEFVCVCSHVFFGTAWMNHTKSPCYKCDFLASPSRIMPPTPRNEPRKSRAPHSCDGANCYNRARGQPPFSGRQGAPSAAAQAAAAASASAGAANRQPVGRFAAAQPAADSPPHHRDNDAPVCSHQQSPSTKRVLYPSPLHVSTGSTVNTFMSQGELAEDYQDLQPMPRLQEEDED